MDDKHQYIEMALSLGQSIEIHDSRSDEPATEECLSKLAVFGIKLDRPLSMLDAHHLLGLFQPPTNYQLEILNHFKVKNRSNITRTRAIYLIQTIFSDPANIRQWKQRPVTSKVKQGILFMGGRLNSGMSQLEAQSKLMQYGMENPHRFLEWKHIENLFMSVNDTGTLEQYEARKITWKRFFQIYDALKSTGVESVDINADKIHRHGKQVVLNQ